MSTENRFSADAGASAKAIVIEKEIDIPLGDGKRAYGWMREVEDAPVVVMTHGHTCSIFGHPYHYGARQISAVGFSVYRFGFYAYPSNARTTTDVTFEDHIDDLDSVVEYFKERAHRVSVIGHSIGGLAALNSRSKAFDCLVTWDASHPDVLNPSNWPDLWIWDDRLDCWRFENGLVSLADPRLLAAWSAIDVERAVETLTMPVKFIAAGSDVCLDAAKTFYEVAAGEKALHVIEGADHDFLRDAHADELLVETLDWLNTYGR